MLLSALHGLLIDYSTLADLLAQIDSRQFPLRQKGSIRIHSGQRKTPANPRDFAGAFGERLGYGQPLRGPERDSELTGNHSVRHASAAQAAHGRMVRAIEPCGSAPLLASRPDAR